MRHAIRLAFLVSFLGFVAALALRSIEEGGVPETPNPTNAPQRYLAYVATADAGPRFALDEGAGYFRFITFLHVPQATTAVDYEPSVRYQYALRFTVRDEEGRALHTREVAFVTRKSKRGPSSEGWEEQSAYYPLGGAGEPCDPRMLDIDLSAHLGPGRVLDVRAVGPDGAEVQTNLIAFTAFEREEARVEWLLGTVDPTRTAELAERARVADRGSTTPAELRQILARGWRRQSTLNNSPLRTLYSTGFRLELEQALDLGVAVGPQRAAVLNLHGPAILRLSLRTDDPAPQTVRIQTLRSSGGAVSRTVEQHDVVPHDATAPGDPPRDGVVTLALAAGESASFTVTAPDGPGRLFAVIPEATPAAGEHALVRRAHGGVLVAPDRKEATLWAVTNHPVSFTLRDGQTPVDAVMLTLRRRAGSAPASIWWAFEPSGEAGVLANDGADTMTETVSSTVAGEAPPMLSTEPASYRFWIPDGAQRLRVWTDDARTPQWLSASVLSTAATTPSSPRAPYLAAPAGLRWRYAPREQSSWYPVAPDRAAELADSERRYRLHAQVRWAPTAEDEETPDAAVPSQRPTLTLAPAGKPRRAIVIERAKDDDWSDAHRVVLHANDPGVRCSTATNRRLSILLHGPVGGAPYTVTWDGIPLRRRLLRTTSDRFTIRTPTRAGVLRIETPADASTEPLTAWAACSPLTPDTAGVVLRRVHALRAGHPLRIPFVADPENPGYANVIVYGPSSGLIRATIDDGDPDRRAGPVQLLTMAARTIQWSDVPMDSRLERDATPLSAPVSAAIPLGGDLAPGPHTLRLEWLGPPGSSVWVRAFRYQ